MNIQEATKLAMEQQKFISRIYFINTFKVKIKPTNGYVLCESYPLNADEIGAPNPRRGWQPKAEDLVADDWVVID
ncbi:Thoeris anti-defense Tad2 family protein [Bacillus thuringiensis]|uniref:Thoeris anti-defense Tad2 family protein n=1 Tax=Bacillus thuringiensis TaxID=1428 RepID=UPI002D80D51A|nr:aspartate ammonia-lyase [Bacillus thuringiensis]MEB4814613.1 aspartate ammonia-lyase [Bacillus thuringiensis]